MKMLQCSVRHGMPLNIGSLWNLWLCASESVSARGECAWSLSSPLLLLLSSSSSLRCFCVLTAYCVLGLMYADAHHEIYWKIIWLLLPSLAARLLNVSNKMDFFIVSCLCVCVCVLTFYTSLWLRSSYPFHWNVFTPKIFKYVNSTAATTAFISLKACIY